MKNRSIFVLAVVVFAVCGAVMWYLQRQPALPDIPAMTTPTPVVAVPTPAPKPVAAGSQAEPAKPTEVVKPNKPAPKPLAQWEVKIDQLLSSSISETETAQLLINMIPTLPTEGQAEASQHITNLLSDQEYKRALPLLKNTKLPEEVLDVLVTDLMNRDDQVKLPALLEVAKLPDHPHHEEALTDLQIFLDVDHGTDWNKWNGSLAAYLKKQAEENAALEAAPPAPVKKPVK